MTATELMASFFATMWPSFSILERHFAAPYTPRVQDLDGKYRDFYASANEELVEHALRKLAVKQQAGYFDQTNYRSGVVFSLYSCVRNYRSAATRVPTLNILSSEHHRYRLRRILCRSTYLPFLAAASRAHHEASGLSDRCRVRRRRFVWPTLGITFPFVSPTLSFHPFERLKSLYEALVNVTRVVKSPISGCEPSFSGVISFLFFSQP